MHLLRNLSLDLTEFFTAASPRIHSVILSRILSDDLAEFLSGIPTLILQEISPVNIRRILSGFTPNRTSQVFSPEYRDFSRNSVQFPTGIHQDFLKRFLSNKLHTRADAVSFCIFLSYHRLQPDSLTDVTHKKFCQEIL